VPANKKNGNPKWALANIHVPKNKVDLIDSQSEQNKYLSMLSNNNY